MDTPSAVKADTRFSLKDQLFNQHTVTVLADAIQASNPSFKRKIFIKETLAAFPALALKQRIGHLVMTLNTHLPKSFKTATNILLDALPAPLDPTRSDNDFGEYIWVVPGEYVAQFGCTPQHLERALTFLEASTQRFSAENAIRPFLNNFQSTTLDFLTDCTHHSNYHVRRLASEGTRPLLPWSPRVSLPQNRVFALLDSLHADPTRYVTRSVANALNDYSKLDPNPVLDHLKAWQKQGKQAPDELAWLKKHALRTLIKQSHPDAMALMGFTQSPQFRLQNMRISDAVKIGGALSVSAKITVPTSQTLSIGLRLYFLKANGGYGNKLYKVRQGHFQPGQPIHLEKRITLKPMTTRALYPGTHHVAIEINGVTRGKHAFTLHT